MKCKTHLINNGILLAVHLLLGGIVCLILQLDFIQDAMNNMSWYNTPLLIIFIVYLIAYFLWGFLLLRPVDNLRGLSVLSIPVFSGFIFILMFYVLPAEEFISPVFLFLNMYGLACISLLNTVPFLAILVHVLVPPVFTYLGMVLRDHIKYVKV